MMIISYSNSVLLFRTFFSLKNNEKAITIIKKKHTQKNFIKIQQKKSVIITFLMSYCGTWPLRKWMQTYINWHKPRSIFRRWKVMSSQAPQLRRQGCMMLGSEHNSIWEISTKRSMIRMIWFEYWRPLKACDIKHFEKRFRKLSLE